MEKMKYLILKVSEANDLILNPDKYGFENLNFSNLNLFRIYLVLGIYRNVCLWHGNFNQFRSDLSEHISICYSLITRYALLIPIVAICYLLFTVHFSLFTFREEVL